MSEKSNLLPYELEAMRGDPMPDGLNLGEFFLFSGLRLLYHQYRIGNIDREKAKSEKLKLSRAYSDYVRNEKHCEMWARLLVATEKAATKYRKERTLENADELMKVVYGFVG